jgi:uncharacterized protein (TIGR03118 family)
MKRTHRLTVLESLESRLVPTAYAVTNLVSDQAGVAAVTDSTLVNAWGIAVGPRSFWVSANGSDLSEVYVGDVNGSPLVAPFKVTIPGGKPTGQVANLTTDFVVSDGNGNSGPAAFIFASESGAVTGWNPVVPPGSRVAQPAFQATDDAIYKGIALANNGTGNFLYLADFHNGKIDVLDSQFHLTHLAGDFTDPHPFKGFAPFNVAAIGDKLYVSYAKQDADAEDDVQGQGLGFVNVFDLNGNFVERFVNRGRLNAPWGMVQAPADFGQFSGDILIGNFGDGRINAYDPVTREFQGALSTRPGRPIAIDGLWGLAFGNSRTAGDANALYFAAGPDDETHGLFGSIRVVPSSGMSILSNTGGAAHLAANGLGSMFGGAAMSRPVGSVGTVQNTLPPRAATVAPVLIPPPTITNTQAHDASRIGASDGTLEQLGL